MFVERRKKKRNEERRSGALFSVVSGLARGHRKADNDIVA
jgi:hypothetical protein